jgi:hypothetical protein
MCIKTRGCKYSVELLMMGGMLLETYSAFNKFWNNKFYYKVCILLVVSTDSSIATLRPQRYRAQNFGAMVHLSKYLTVLLTLVCRVAQS